MLGCSVLSSGAARNASATGVDERLVVPHVCRSVNTEKPAWRGGRERKRTSDRNEKRFGNFLSFFPREIFFLKNRKERLTGQFGAGQRTSWGLKNWADVITGSGVVDALRASHGADCGALNTQYTTESAVDAKWLPNTST